MTAEQISPELPNGHKQNSGVWNRLKNIDHIFACTVLFPTTLAVVYYGLIASDIYVSEAKFVIRSPQKQNQSSLVGAILQGTGFSRASDDTYPVIDYIQSRDALKQLNTGNTIIKAYGASDIDFLSRFSSFGLDDSFEALLRYYQKNIVEVEYDSTSAITTLRLRAFSAADSQKFNQQLMKMSEDLINRLNQRASHDLVSYAERDVERAQASVRNAAVALSSYRNDHSVFDPEKQSALQLQQVTKLQDELANSQLQLAQLQAAAPANPQIASLKIRIASLQAQIADANKQVMGNKDSLSNKAVKYDRLQLESTFADRQLASALASLETARNEAARQQLYLEYLVEPNKADKAMEPKRFKSIFEVFALGMLVWGVLSLLLAGVREHHD